MLLGIRWGSLRAKIIAWSFVPTAIILVAVAVVILFAYQAVTQDLAIERNRELTRLSASELATELTEFTNLLTALARTVDIYEGNPIAQREALKDAHYRLTVFDAGGLILNAFGTAVATEPERPEILGQRWSDRTIYRQIVHHQTLNSESPAISDIVADGPDGAEVIVVAVPIKGEFGEFKGIIAGLFHVGETADNAFYSNIVKLRLGESGLHLVDGNGRLIYHSDADLIGDDFWGQAVVQNVLDGQVGALRTRARDGQDIVTGFAPVRGTAWGLITEESWAALTDASRSYGQFLLLLLLLGVLAPAVVVNVGVKRITNPISELISAAQEVAGGNFGQTITARTGDEIEELAEQFNLMSAQLQESYAHLEQRVADRTKELAALNAIAQTVSRSLELEGMLTAALGEVLEVLELESGAIYLKDPKTDGLLMACHCRLTEAFQRVVAKGIISARVAESGNPIIVDDLSKEPDAPREVVEEGYRSVASIPLLSKGQVQGVLTAASCQSRRFRQRDVDLLLSIGHQIGVAIENARLFNAVQRRAEQFKVISKVGRHITSILAVDELLDQLVVLIQKTLNYDTVEIALIEGDELVFKARVKRRSTAPFESFRLKVGEQGITGLVAATGEPLLVPDVSQDPRYIQMSESVSRSEFAVPIQTKDKVIGVLNVQSEQLNAFDESDLTVIQSLADQAAIAIENASFFKAEQRRAEQFRVISKVGRHITSILDENELLEEIVRLLRKTFGYYLITIGLIEGDMLVFKAGAKTHWGDPEFRPPPTKVGGRGITAWVAATGEPILAPDVSQEPRFLFLPDAAETRSELAVPLKTKTAIIGVLNVESDQLNAFDESDLVVLQSLAYQAAVAIENARLFTERERRIDEMAALNEVGRAISSALQLDELLDLIHHQVSRVMDATNLYIALYDRDEDWVSFPLYVEGGQVRRGGRGRKAGQGLTEYIVRSRQPLLLSDDVEGRMQEMGIKAIGAPARSWLGVPMIAGDKVLGIIAVQSYATENVYDEEHLNLLPTIAAQAAIAIENARLYEQARQLAVMEERQRLARELHDAVTQTLFSASLIAEALPTIWESDQDEGQQLLQDLRQLSRGALAEMRTLLMELRPAALVEANLADLLRQLGEAVAGRTGVLVTVTVEDQHELPPDVHVALYRITQEVLNNVVKHARASQVAVSLRCAPHTEGGVELQVSDDGRGFDPSSVPSDHLGLGLGIIRERVEAIGATLNIESQPGHGTQVMVVWTCVELVETEDKNR